MTIDIELKPFIEGLAQAWPEPTLSLDVATWRERAERLSAQARPPYPEGMKVQDLQVPGQPRDVTVRIYRPQATTITPSACLMYMHGGGWVIGSHETHDAITAAIAQQAAMVVVSVHYARAPEHPYPAAVEDCQTVLSWLFDQGAAQGIDPTRIFVGGDSAGGNLATVMALLYREDAHRRLRGQALIYPCVDTDFTRPSYLSEAQAPFLKAAEMIWFWGQYCPNPAQRLEATAAPIHISDFSGMAPALVMVAEHDPLRDEGTHYANLLQNSGVETQFRPGKGLIHGHLRAGGLCQAAANEFQALCDWLKALSK
ncbi:alpha/beta hydrolase [Alcaligenaceae bacterium CGII-47]|nr:alpha/beta hydrolase [Alcaligenaceae bacterium CGII-47]